MAIDDQVTDESLASVLKISHEARAQALELVSLIEKYKNSPGDNDTRAEISRQQKLLTTNVARLRGLQRNAYFAARDTKAVTAEARQQVDRLHLQLQNLYYEQRHLQGEIEACESFSHKYQELPLIPVEDFLAQNPEHADDDENALMIARIDHEKSEREALEQQRQELLKRKTKLISENKRRREDLANLDKDLEKFIDAAKPIQKLFEKVV
ncbi:Fms-interacting protein-domain-containing protein [Coniochaeta sp. 2T2.1]|nr:Fms-interacting protein-domain-containing protein [Coniochaeta sp. 2T2.1]